MKRIKMIGIGALVLINLFVFVAPITAKDLVTAEVCYRTDCKTNGKGCVVISVPEV